MNKLSDSIVAEWLAYQAFHSSHHASARLLGRLLTQSSQTIFGASHRLRATMTIDQFRKAVPIRTYTEFKGWIDRIVDGEEHTLWPGRPSAFATTSGTASESKLLPITPHFLRDYHLGNLLTFHRMAIHAPSSVFRSILTLGGPSEEDHIGGVPVGSITGILYESLPDLMSSWLVVPSEVHNIRDEKEKLYIISRLVLEASISGIITVIPGTLLVLYESINRMAGTLIKEIHEGSMSRLVSTPQHLEVRIRRGLRPNPGRARHLQKLIDRDGKLLPSHIWPVAGLCTYTKQAQPTQWKLIRELYGNMRIIDPGLVATEGRVSIGLYPDRQYHGVLPLSSFVELIPLDDDDSMESSNVQSLLPHEVEVGKLYCPVISSANGLLRYKLEDVVSVHSMRRGVPLIEYVGRLDDSLSIAGEKVCDVHIRGAIDRLNKSGVSIEGAWTVGVSWDGAKPFYNFTWETKQSDSQLSQQMDATLQLLNVSYRRKRAQGLLLPLKATPVQPGQICSSDTHVRWIGQSKPRVLFNRDLSPPRSTSVLHD